MVIMGRIPIASELGEQCCQLRVNVGWCHRVRAA
jgi:hypothetical protein